MSIRSPHLKYGFLIVASLVWFAATSPPAQAAGGSSISLDSNGNPNPRLRQPHSHPYGHTFGEWTARWWQWAISLPVDHHPLFDTAPCDAGQSGPVWFLGGAFSGIATTRDCSIPTGLSILLPVLNAECSNVEDPPFHGDTEAEQLACARSFMDTGTGMSATIDGRAVQDITHYRVSSPQFSFSAPANGLFGLNAVSGTSVSDGVWLFLNPLPAGHHTIHFMGSFPGFPIDVTYNLTIVPGGRGHGHLETESDETGMTEGVTKTTWGKLKLIYR